VTVRDRSRRVRSCVSSILTAAGVLTLFAASVAAQDTTGVGAISGVVVNAAGQLAEGVRVCALDTASSSEPKVANAKGAITWKWVVAGNASKGRAPIVITTAIRRAARRMLGIPNTCRARTTNP